MSTWVLHRGALGDCILLWPLLRALRSRGPVTLVGDLSKARLAARFLGVEARSAEDHRFSLLWSPDAGDRLRAQPIGGVTRVLAFLDGSAVSVWEANATVLFPGAGLELFSGRLDRPRALELARRNARPAAWLPAPRSNPGGPVVIHVGAGSPAKRWPVAGWISIISLLRDHAIPLQLLAGEVEVERFGADERREFDSLSGRYLSTLDDLGDALAAARLFLGFDSGPAHLAAALGVPVLSVFLSTDPELWAPVARDAAGTEVIDARVDPGGAPDLLLDALARRLRITR